MALALAKALQQASTVVGPPLVAGRPRQAVLLSAKAQQPLPVSEPDGTKARGLFTVLNHGRLVGGYCAGGGACVRVCRLCVVCVSVFSFVLLLSLSSFFFSSGQRLVLSWHSKIVFGRPDSEHDNVFVLARMASGVSSVEQRGGRCCTCVPASLIPSLTASVFFLLLLLFLTAVFRKRSWHTVGG